MASKYVTAVETYNGRILRIVTDGRTRRLRPRRLPNVFDGRTTGQRWTSGVIHGNYSADTAEVIVEAPAYDYGKRFYDLAPFGSVQFYNLGIGGVYALVYGEPGHSRSRSPGTTR